jgi:putative membrane protein
MLLVIVLAVLQTDPASPAHGVVFTGLSLGYYGYLLICGIIASSAMIIPGVSGSFILIMMGAYWIVLSSLSGLTSILPEQGLTPEMMVRLQVLISLGIGVVIGILVISRLMSWALKNYPAVTMYFILGLIIGSIYQIFPGIDFSWRMGAAVVTFVIGILISLKFGENPAHKAKGQR